MEGTQVVVGDEALRQDNALVLQRRCDRRNALLWPIGESRMHPPEKGPVAFFTTHMRHIYHKNENLKRFDACRL